MKLFGKTVNIIPKLNEDIFESISGRDDIKRVLKRALYASKPVHMLLDGPPGNNKTGFLRAIERKYKGRALYLNFTATSGPGAIMDIINHKPRYLLIDEIEKASKDVRAKLLDLMENGRITYTLKKQKIDMKNLEVTVIATCNHSELLSEEFIHRMQVVKVKPYELEEYINVAVFRLKQENIDQSLAEYIARAIHDRTGEQNIRACVRVAREAKTQQDVDELLDDLEALG
jgi:Holliday junction DNA helicase RuvB